MDAALEVAVAAQHRRHHQVVVAHAVGDRLRQRAAVADACWALLTFGDVCHAFTDPQANVPGRAVYDEPATRHGYALAHAFIADAFAGKRHGCPAPSPA